MTGDGVWAQLLPAAHRPVTLRDAIPLGVFLVGFAGIWCGLEWSQWIQFTHPEALFWLNLCPWIWWLSVTGDTGLSQRQGAITLLLRLSLIGFCVMILAEPCLVRTRDVRSVIYALDVSDSVGDAGRQALDFIVQTATAKPERDEAGLIAYGRGAAVELPPRVTFPFEALHTQIDRDATDLEEMLRLAAALIPDENQGRIVIVGDGTQTEGNYRRVLKELQTREIAVDVLPIHYHSQREVWLEQLELPSSIKPGEHGQAIVTLVALSSGQGTLILNKSGIVQEERPVLFPAGKSRFTFPIAPSEPGEQQYSATIQVAGADDQRLQNNTVYNDLLVESLATAPLQQWTAEHPWLIEPLRQFASADSSAWHDYRELARQFLISLSPEKATRSLAFKTSQAGGQGTLLIEDLGPEGQLLDVVAYVTGPGLRRVTIPCSAESSRRYTGQLTFWNPGRYQIEIHVQGGGWQQSLHGRMILSYSPEYQRISSSVPTIEEITSLTGGRILTLETSADDLFLANRKPRVSSLSVVSDWLWVLAFLVPLEVAVRRIQWDPGFMRGFFTREVALTSLATVGTLRERREKVREELSTYSLPIEEMTDVRSRLLPLQYESPTEDSAADLPELSHRQSARTTTSILREQQRKRTGNG